MLGHGYAMRAFSTPPLAKPAMSCPRDWCSPKAPFCADQSSFDLTAFCTSSTPGACGESTPVYLGVDNLGTTKCKTDSTGKVVCTSTDATNPTTYECPTSCGGPKPS
jgi:hypothetical protein